MAVVRQTCGWVRAPTVKHRFYRFASQDGDLHWLEPGAVTAWHHHGEYETSLYVLQGVVRLEFGVNGTQVIEGGAGDIIHVPAGAVHRELNDGDTVASTVMTRVGRGQSMYEVEGPQTD